jgi:carbon-monoxide dehydrogenase large subunit
MAARFGSGQAVRRIEDPALLTGQGRYTDDLRPADGLLHLVFVRSTYAHARLLAVDITDALAAPGVVAVFTGADLQQAGVKPMTTVVPFRRPDGSPALQVPRPVLALDKVRFVGDMIAAVVAESREAAERAAERVMVEVEELPAVADMHAALAQGAVALSDQAADNVVAQTRHGDAAACAAAFARAHQVVALDLVNQRLAPSAMEPRVVLAESDAQSGRLTVTLSSQMPSAVRDGLAQLLPGQTTASVRVRVHDVGGGFGMKTGLYAEDVVVAFAALRLGRAVKWRGTRLEEFCASVHGRDQNTHAEMALDAAGKVLALRIRTVANVGAYPLPPGLFIPLLIGPWVTTSVYDIPTIDLTLTAVLSNNTPVGAYRGAGRPEAIYMTERLMDAAARRLGLDRVEIRRRNLIRPEQMPYTNPMGQTYDVGQFERMLDQALELGDWAGYTARQAESRARGRLRGRALSTFLEWTSGNAFTEAVKVRVLPEGVIELTSATQAMGQGIATSYAQLAVDVFGVSIDKIRILQGDTDAANGFGSAGSRSLFTGGSAVQVAAEKTVKHAKDLAAEALEAPAGDVEYRDGRFDVVGTDLGIGLFELAARQPTAHIAMDGETTAQAPSWPNACHLCEVEIDPDTGAVELAAYASVNDIGRVVSPVIVEGQIEGGAMQGMGQALSEQVVYSEDAQPLNASFMDYALPRADSFIGFKTRFDTSVPCTTNLLGVKGVGELGTIGATPVVVNAVIDALSAAGLGEAVERLQMPLTPARVWKALHGDTAAAADGQAAGPVVPQLPAPAAIPA